MKRFFTPFLVLLILTGCFTGCKQPAPLPPAETTAPTEAPPLTVDPRFESLEQEAVVKTALAFLARGQYIQYDDTRFSPDSEPVVYRWEVGLKSPEDYTRQAPGYTNCAAFTHDVYLEALDYDIGAYTTAALSSKGTSQRIYTYIPTGKETAEEKAAVEADFRSKLKIGDIIVVRYNGKSTGNGHAMLYVGTEVLENGKDIIHSTGSNYSYKSFTEQAEGSGTVQTMSSNRLFYPTGSLYVFSNLLSLSIVRPLNTYGEGVPAKTQNRIRNLEGIVAEKLSSHTKAMSVNPGDQMSFQFTVSNRNDAPVTLEIRDIVPANTTYLSGAETVDGNALCWQLTVPAKQTASVSYTVQVNADAPYGEMVYSDAGTVGGVDVDCPRVYIAKTLSQDEQEKLLVASGNIPAKTGIALADAIYTQALGKTTGLPADFTTLHNSFFEPFFLPHYRLKGEGGMLNLIPTGMFGGRRISHRTLVSDYIRLEYLRTRLPQPEDMVIGDIILAVGGPNATATTENLYMFIGKKCLNLFTGKTVPSQSLLNSLLGYERFVVIRPSIGM